MTTMRLGIEWRAGSCMISDYAGGERNHHVGSEFEGCPCRQVEIGDIRNSYVPWSMYNTR